MPIATCSLPPVDEFAHRGGRFGRTIFTRIFRLRIPGSLTRSSSGHFITPAPLLSPSESIQLKDVFADERGVVYAVDRHVGGLYVLQMDF